MAAPPAQGVRVDWDAIPVRVRAAIERICGARVVQASSQPGGFSPGVAARVHCADGSKHFVKAVSAIANPDTPGMHRREAHVLRGLDPLIASGELPAPRLRGLVEDDGWTALVLDDINGRHPGLPWQQPDLDRMLAALDQLATILTPPPIGAPLVTQSLGADFTGWRTLAAAGGDDRLDAWSASRLAELAALEATWPQHAAGQTLLHADVRADNVLLTGDRVVFVDWPHACVGASFIDLVFFAPSVAMQGGPDPAELMARSAAARQAGQRALTAVVCAMAGYLTARSLQPPPPGLPTVRAFQAAQGKVARRWLASLLT